MTQVASVMHPTMSGGIVLRRIDGTEQHWTPDRCSSGDIARFVGFDFLSTHDEGHLRVVLEPIDGPAVRWTYVAGSTQDRTVLRRADCARLDVDVQPTAWEVNDVREFAGYVDLQCDLPGGLHIEGRIAVDHCH
ncbi:MAG TPA: hypothetical protein VFI49_00170 [Rudaea sp.]|nr:hypothetical protein [Rudaea sp.]